MSFNDIQSPYPLTLVNFVLRHLENTFQAKCQINKFNLKNSLIFMIKLNALDLTMGGGEGEGVRIKFMRTRAYQKAAGED